MYVKGKPKLLFCKFSLIKILKIDNYVLLLYFLLNDILLSR